MRVFCWNSQLLKEKALSIHNLRFHLPYRALGRPVSQLLLFTATFCSIQANPPHEADDGLNSQPPFRAEARKYQLSLFRG